MKDSLQPGIRYQHTFVVPDNKTVPYLYPESTEFTEMPEVFATGFLVGLLEWSCIKALNPHLDWPHEQTVGTHIDVTHEAATPPGFAVTATVELVEVDGKRLIFEVEAKITSLPDTNAYAKKLKRLMVGNATEVELDSAADPNEQAPDDSGRDPSSGPHRIVDGGKKG